MATNSASIGSKLRRRLVWSLLLAVLGARVDAADCDSVVAAAVAEDPAIRAAQAAVSEARAGASALRWLDPPEVRLRSDAATRNDQARLGVRWPLPGPGVASASAQAAQAREAMALAEVDALAARTAAAVRADCAELRHAREQRELSEHLMTAAARHSQAVQTRTSAGISTALAEEHALLDAAEAQEQALQARAREDAAVTAMRRWTAEPLALDRHVCIAPAEINAEDAAGRHPSVRLARAAVLAAESEDLAVQRRHWLWPSFVQVSWVRELSERHDGVLVETGVKLPLPDKETAASAARLDTRRFELQAAERRAEAEITAAAAAAGEAAAAVNRMEAGADSLARAQALVGSGTEAGADPQELWRLDRRLAERRQRLSTARYQAELKCIELRRMLGQR
ncbi:MAG: TolC family protein [Deltaproteobacteria bacterium]|nr:TolC family protein [Deltaproteobacteria bacterium]